MLFQWVSFMRYSTSWMLNLSVCKLDAFFRFEMAVSYLHASVATFVPALQDLARYCIFQQCRHLCSCSSGPRQVFFSSFATFVPALLDLARYSSTVSPPLFLLFWTTPEILQHCRYLCSCSSGPRQVPNSSSVAIFVPALQDLARYLSAVSLPLFLVFRTSPGVPTPYPYLRASCTAIFFYFICFLCLYFLHFFSAFPKKSFF
jgi:hypothetical protein